MSKKEKQEEPLPIRLAREAVADLRRRWAVLDAVGYSPGELIEQTGAPQSTVYDLLALKDGNPALIPSLPTFLAVERAISGMEKVLSVGLPKKKRKRR